MMRTKKTVRLLGGMVILGFMLGMNAPHMLGSHAPEIIKTLIITGQNNHNWKVSSPILEQILDDSGLFEADIATSPPKGGNMAEFSIDFMPYQLVVLDYNGDDWPDPVKKGFLDFVRSGGGVVVYHAADNAFPKWKEFNRIIGLGGWGNRDEKSGPYVFWQKDKVVSDSSPGVGGYHGDQHAFMVVNRDTSHPITQGLPEKWMQARDELYSLLRGPGENMHILATAYSDPATRGTGRDEPVLFTITYGKGRIFHTVIGHAMGDGPPPAMQSVGFIVTFLRGAEWAATGKVTQKIPGDFPAVYRDSGTPDDIRFWPDYRPPDLKKILERVATYDYGKDEEVLAQLRDYVRALRNSPESKKTCEKILVRFLESDVTLAAKQAACRHLREIGSAASVPVLGKMLLGLETSDMARYALEKIPGAEAERILVKELAGTDGKIRLGIIDSLGNSEARSSVSHLAKVISGSDETAAIASAMALGQIASPEASVLLSHSLGQASGELKDQVAFSLLKCAGRYLDSGDSQEAIKIYELLIQSELPLPIRQAAIMGQIASSGDLARKVIVDALKGKNQDWHAPAIAMVKNFYDTSTIQEVVPFLPNLPAESQIQLLQALSHFRVEGVRVSIVSAVKNPDPLVRMAAIKALEAVGNYTVVEFLVSHAAQSKGKEQLAARASLWALRCSRANSTILTNLVKNLDEAVQHELILAVGERRIKEGLNLLLSRAQYSSDRNRLLAIRGLKNIASPSDLPLLANLLLGMKMDADQMEMASTIASVAYLIPLPIGRARAIMDTLESVTDVNGLILLYRTLGKIGDDSSLPVIRAALTDENSDVKDAAVRALAEWPTETVKEDLLHIARTSEVPVHKILALQAYIRKIGMEPYRSPESAVRSFQDVLDIARSEDKKLILGTLPTFASPDALELAQTLLQEKEVEAEAQLAIQKIKEKLQKD
ncbi:MAG: HEAT repeat domain-containing protein [Candidatus Aminicenantes bacterium]|nr:MAG: HEAT repeat domain-containing protein [Candidatus Aminicenantes bacterium]